MLVAKVNKVLLGKQLFFHYFLVSSSLSKIFLLFGFYFAPLQNTEFEKAAMLSDGLKLRKSTPSLPKPSINVIAHQEGLPVIHYL